MRLKRWIAVVGTMLATALACAACGGHSHADALNSWGDCAMNVLAAHGVSPTVSHIPSNLVGAVSAKCGTGPN